MIRLYDAHNHLQDERFAGCQDELLRTARDAGIVRMVVNGSGVGDWPVVADLAHRHPDIVHPSFGVHPWYVHEQPADWLARLARQLDAHPRAGVGEIGLDRWKPDLTWEGQEAAFRAQLQLAAERNRPVSIHCLQAWGPLVEILEAAPRPACGFLLHSFGGAKELVPRLAALGAYFSLPGYYAHERKARQRDTFRVIPPDRLLIETDAPDQLPPESCIAHPLAAADGTPLHHPANLSAIHAFAARTLDLSPDALAARVESNFIRLFGP